MYYKILYLLLISALMGMSAPLALADEAENAERAMLGINIGSGHDGEGPVEGVTILGVSPGGPADRAGLRAGDTLVSIGDQSLTADSTRQANRQLVNYMDGVQPKDRVKLTYLRDGRSRKATLEAERMDPNLMPAFPFGESLQRLGEDFEDRVLRPMVRPWRYAGIFRGMELVELSPDLGRYFGTSTGILVIRAPQSDELGLRDGDVIRQIGGREPRDPAHAMRILRSYEPGEKLSLNIMRDQQAMTLSSDLPAPPAKRDQAGEG